MNTYVYINVASWLVARFAIVADISKLFRTHDQIGSFTIVVRLFGRPVLVTTQNVCVERILTCFSGKNYLYFAY